MSNFITAIASLSGIIGFYLLFLIYALIVAFRDPLDPERLEDYEYLPEPDIWDEFDNKPRNIPKDWVYEGNSI